MPSPRAVLIDIEEKGLDPKVAHTVVGGDGSLKSRSIGETSDEVGVVVAPPQDVIEPVVHDEPAAVIVKPIAEEQDIEKDAVSQPVDVVSEIVEKTVELDPTQKKKRGKKQTSEE
jgi:hypothetical protein